MGIGIALAVLSGPRIATVYRADRKRPGVGAGVPPDRFRCCCVTCFVSRAPVFQKSSVLGRDIEGASPQSFHISWRWSRGLVILQVGRLCVVPHYDTFEEFPVSFLKEGKRLAVVSIVLQSVFHEL